MTNTDEGVTPMPKIPLQLTRREVDELYVLTSLIEPYLAQKKS